MQRGESRDRARWSGRLFVWGTRGLYLGPTFRTERHAHHAVQLCFALERSLRLRSGSAAKWSAASTVLIPSDETHQIDGGGDLVALIFLDPESPAARTLCRGAASVGIETTASLRAKLLSCWRDGCRSDTAARLCDEIIDALVPDGGGAASLDPRVARALQLLQSAPERRMTLPALAATVGTSQSRLVHLFGQQTGVPIRRYLLWLRLSDALRHAGLSVSLTQVAHAVGFADSAHLSRTFRRMLGLAPSALLKQ